MMTQCDSCAYYNYDEEFDDYLCDADLDEDEMARFFADKQRGCPYWRSGDEYKTARRQ